MSDYVVLEQTIRYLTAPTTAACMMLLSQLRLICRTLRTTLPKLCTILVVLVLLHTTILVTYMASRQQHVSYVYVRQSNDTPGEEGRQNVLELSRLEDINNTKGNDSSVHSVYMFDVNGADQQKLDASLSKSSNTAQLNGVGNVTLDSNNLRNYVAKKRNFTQEEELFFRKKPDKVNKYVYDFVISGSTICDEDTVMITLIHSWHKYSDRRDAIRQSWGMSAAGKGWPNSEVVTDKLKMAFIFGTHSDKDMNEKVAREHATHGDVIQGNFGEDYRNMTLKSLLGLKWVALYCPQAKFLLKSDDDMLVNIPMLTSLLMSSNLSRTIVGPYCPHSKVYRKGKWALTKEQYPFQFFPPYFAGSSYVITTDLVVDLYETAEYVPPIHIDDVYITGFLAKILNLTVIDRPGFAYGNSKPPSACQFLTKGMLAATKMTPARLKTIWKEFYRKDLTCT